MVLIFILAYAGVKIWYNRFEENLLTSLPAAKVVAAKPVVNKVASRQKASDYRVIIDRNIFGAVLEEPVEEVKEVEPEPELEPTKLKLALMGTVSGNQRDSRAIVLDEISRQQDIYAVGDTVQEALIVAIERRRIVLSVNGKDEVLNIKERIGGTAPLGSGLSPAPEPAQHNTLRRRSSARRSNIRPARSSRTPPVVRPPGGNQPAGTDISAATDEYGEQAENPDTVNEEQPEPPEFTDGQPFPEPQ